MTIYLWNVAAYAVQLAVLVTAAFAATRLLGLRVPNMSLRFWQAMMAIALLLPLAQARPQPQRADDLMRVIVQSGPILTATQAGAALAPEGVDTATIVMLILAAGIVLRLAWLGAGLLRLRSIVAHAVPEPAMVHAGSNLGRSLGVTATLMISDELEGPATVGVRNPVILMPRSVLQMPAAVQRAIICHELLHVKRRDWVHTIVEEIWCAVLWFHPGARVIASRLSLSREMVVDELTILATRDRRAYAEALLAFSDPQPHLIGATPFIGRHTLSQRISLIAEEAPMSRRALAGFALALTAVIGVSVAVINRFPMAATPPASPAQLTIYDPGPGISLPTVVTEVKPAYTAAAMRERIQGSIWTKVVVGPNGDVLDASITRSLDPKFGLDEEALRAARLWKFTPAVKDGQPVAVRVTIELTYTLR
jgi:TonB family protein